MLEIIYRKDNINLVYDIEEDLFYLRVGGVHNDDVVCYTQDYTKEEFVAILKEMVKTLEE